MSGPCLCGDPACGRCFPQAPPEFAPVPKWAAGLPEIADTLERARLTFYCANCYRKRPTRFLTPNFGPFCEDCLLAFEAEGGGRE